MRRACRSVDHRANKNNDGRQSHLRVHSKQIFILFRVGRTEKRDERTRREERREAHKKRQKESAERISHRRSIHSFVVFDGPKKKILRRPFLLFLVFFPLNSYVTRYRQFLLIAMRVWQRYFGRVNGTKKTPKEKETKPFISDLSLDETTR